MMQAALCVLDAPDKDIRFFGHLADTGSWIIDSVDSTRDQWSIQFWKFDDRINPHQHWSECDECIVRVYFCPQ